MKTRIVTGLVLLGIAFWVTYQGGWWLWAWIYVVGILSTYEIFKMLKNKEIQPYEWPGYLAVTAAFLSVKIPFFVPFWSHGLVHWAAGGLIGFCLFEVFSKQVFFPKSPLYATLRVVGFVCLTFPYIYWLRTIGNSPYTFLFCFMMIWVSDSFAYFGGRFFGKTPLTTISPKKTVEGSVIGFVGSVLVAGILCAVLHLPYLSYVVIGGLISVMSMAGDLHESLMKRHFNVKDSSDLLPGHGGFYDRADSALFVSPLAYFYFK